MKIEFQMAKLNPTTKISLDLIPGQPIETDTGFIVPIILPTPDGKQIPVVAIECKLLNVENGVQRISVSSMHYSNGEIGESVLLNDVQIDFSLFIPATNDNEMVLSAAATPPTKSKPG